MQKINLVTVVGHNTTMLKHMLNHYKDIVDEIYVVVYRQHQLDGILEDVINLGINPYKVVTEPKFNWERVTELYNEVKQTKPNEWWVVSDDDEFHIYPKPIREIISDCEENDWEFITGGFIDRIGENGTFPEVSSLTDVWSEFPLAGFFRYPMSGACPNKVCVMKGSINVTPGQHYVDFGNGRNSWGKDNIKHLKRYPIGRGEGLVQVHHFKWDSTVLERLKEVSETKEDYTYWQEYLKMYKGIEMFDWKIDINNPEFMFEKMKFNNHWDYSNWSKLSKKIIVI
jgi:hypothetical protein